MLTINDLRVSYDGEPVLDNLELHMIPGHVHGLIGLNGAGKTTLFNTITGFIKLDKGRGEWCGKPVSRRDIAFLETHNYFYSNITGGEYLNLFKAVNNGFKLDAWQDLFKLPLNELVDNYSTGMKKKLALLGILKLDKPIIFLDEPFNGIDLETGRIIKALLERLKEKNKTIVLTSHILETLTHTCDFVHYLEDKKIKKVYEKEELQQLDKDIFKNIDERTAAILNNAI
jgi:ABC-2 type transport system ATP-binding protein